MQAWTPRANSPWGVEFHGRAQNSANSVQAIHRHRDTAAIAAPSASARIYRDLRHAFTHAASVPSRPTPLFPGPNNCAKRFICAEFAPWFYTCFGARRARPPALPCSHQKRVAISCVCLGKRRGRWFAQVILRRKLAAADGSWREQALQPDTSSHAGGTKNMISACYRARREAN
jgi:hypothetical protein